MQAGRTMQAVPAAARREPRRLRRHAGFTYVWVLATLAVLSVGLAAIGTMHSAQAEREREQDLLRIGALYAQAVAGYYRMSPGSEKRYPPSIEALLLDTRFVGTVRHLRKAYTDPLQPGRPLVAVLGSDGTVRGVHSTSQSQPLRQQPLDLGVTLLPAATQYSQWLFVPRGEP
jgi:type II secretory pathway pseudopilin PulG